MKLGYQGAYDSGIYVYINGELTDYMFRKTCYGSYKIYKSESLITELYNLDNVYQFINSKLLRHYN